VPVVIPEEDPLANPDAKSESEQSVSVVPKRNNIAANWDEEENSIKLKSVTESVNLNSHDLQSHGEDDIGEEGEAEIEEAEEESDGIDEILPRRK
jgi:hypothetical protein